ncbi:DUF4168 domain-containing protein [Rhodovulum steppense]|uniref:Uncharacterized protein DUF4168 n=1 Tax=Rhodovulum steppense TaxID=540251 RepID=A0A4V2R538_9RHOB|nr:DUF4168 domain-containing protein [Rhodovulum steppense]TCM87094.1 uncharacterized protein DUF4168 [Rhodovulum steppense]
MKLARTVSALALATLTGIAMPVAAVAQAQQATPSAENVTGDEIDAFVTAYESVLAIDAEYGAQMAQTTNEAELEGLQEAAQVRKTEAVEATPGIDVDRYVEILAIAQVDAELSARIVDRLER